MENFQPELDEILEKVDCRYSLVVGIAKRSRELVDGDEPLADEPDKNPVTEAIKEINEGKVQVIREND